MIEAFRLGLFSRGKTLWDGLDFAFEDGVAWVIVGPPSSGKTLLLSVLRGVRPPDAGDVLISGESLFRGAGAAARAYRAASGCVTERSDDVRLTVEELFLRSAFASGGISAKERRARQERLLAMVGLPETSREPMSALSGSERARARLAAELVRSPKFLFADGVVSAAGGPFRERLGGLFRALAGEGNTILLAERELPAGWAPIAGGGRPLGPFRVYRFPAAMEKEGPA
jgi:ABC-type multidrug transport system ATPase subunit